jgi:hypothetical protein
MLLCPEKTATVVKGQPKMDETIVAAKSLKPALASIRDSCSYLGGVSRAKFYADILPKLNTVHLGARHLVVVASMDRLIANSAVQGGKERRGIPPKRIAQRLTPTDSTSTKSSSPGYRSRPRKTPQLELRAQEGRDG